MFELLFKYPPAVFRNGDIVLQSGWPLAALAAAIGLAGALLGLQIARAGASSLGRSRAVALWLLQTLAVALVLVLLWRPAVQIAASRPQQNVVAVMVDGSRSMALADPGRGVRLEVARKAIEESLLPALRGRFQVRLYSFSDGVRELEALPAVAAEGATTAVQDSVASVLRTSRVLPLAGVVVLSDGAENARAAVGLDELAHAGIPVHTVGVGREAMGRDLELEDAIVPAQTPAGARLRVGLRLRHRGLAGQRARVTVRDGGRVLARRDLVLSRDTGTQTEELFVAAGEPGPKTLTVAVETDAAEETTANNRVARPLQVVARRARLLYVEGEPRWEMKFIRRALEDDPTLRIVSLLRTSANKVYRQGIDDPAMLAGGFPTRAEELFAYEAVVIGSVEAAYFTRAQQETLKAFVGRRGGSILFLGGRHAFADGGWAAAPLADVLPVRLSARAPTFVRRPARATLTAAGQESLLCLLDDDPARNAARWARLPALADHQATGELKPGAVALLEAAVAGAGSIPLLVTQSYGRGQVLALATGGSWRWRMGLPHDDTSHATFWQQLLRGLTAGSAAPLVVTTDRALYADEPRIAVRAEVRTRTYEPVADARVVATLVSEDGTRDTVELGPAPGPRGLYEAIVTAPRPGRHRLEVRAARGSEDLGYESVVVYREDGVAEGFHPEQNAALLRRVAEATGGRYWTADEVAGIADEITYSGSGLTVRETLDLWDMPIVFLVALGLRVTEWLVRRGGGRV